MATNRERVGRALELLQAGLGPFVDREVKASLLSGAMSMDALQRFSEEQNMTDRHITQWDPAALLKLMWEIWNETFRRTLGFSERSLVSELRDCRNKWAHMEPFSTDDTYRALDSASRLLLAVSAPEADEVERMKLELLRQRYDEQVRGEKRKAGGSLIEGAAAGALRPWREVVNPHPDVSSGRYQQAEFAADLWQVYLGEGSDEYKSPVEFFRRTYLTESLRQLLVGAVQRFSGDRGDPVVQLQTNFGGGKTHSMLALYHLFSGMSPSKLPGIEEILKEAQAKSLPAVRRVILVGNRISPGNPVTKADGTVVRTIWGELAWQLGYAAGGLAEAHKAFERVQADDEKATNPGDVLRQLFNDYAPCLILIDEWVAYARQLHDSSELPGGSFETHFTFAQNLTESAKLANRCLVVISLPASDTGSSTRHQAEDSELGGIRGREALERLSNVIGRVESSWRPASAEESFEIVRRRLFEHFADPEQYKSRDVVARAFADLYRTQRNEFPPECFETEYEERIKAAYPIHPEIFDRLYTDWSSLLNFHRTRGVLRLMAAVIHSLWEKGDKNPLILPSTIPLDDPHIQFELTRYLSDNWAPVIEKDIDGQASLPVRLDGEVPNLGKFSAFRRVARTVYLGSAPTTTAAHRGLEDRRIKLGCIMPGESPAVFGDALRQLARAATFLYQDGSRYWYSIHPTVTKLAEDRAEQLKRDSDKAYREIEKRVKADLRQMGDFPRIHPFPQSGSDVPDDLEAGLVVLGPGSPHIKDPSSPALAEARSFYEFRGSSPRRFRNSLLFLAADKTKLQDLEEAVCLYMAWESILLEKETLDLSAQQVRQADVRRQEASDAVGVLLPEIFQWLLVPTQASPQDSVEWDAIRLQGNGPMAVRASKRLHKEELLVTTLAGTNLRMEMDKVPLWRGDYVSIKLLLEDFARYVYLPRLKSPSVLVEAVLDGLRLLTWEEDSFAYADSFDEASRRFRGLRAAQSVSLPENDPPGMLVKPEVARRQLDIERQQKSKEIGSTGEVTIGAEAQTSIGHVTAGEIDLPVQPMPHVLPGHFHGNVVLNAARVGLDASRIADEVIAHLVGLPDAQVHVILEIEAIVPGGVPDGVRRTVTENSRQLKFSSHGFESEQE